MSDNRDQFPRGLPRAHDRTMRHTLPGAGVPRHDLVNEASLADFDDFFRDGRTGAIAASPRGTRAGGDGGLPPHRPMMPHAGEMNTAPPTRPTPPVRPPAQAPSRGRGKKILLWVVVGFTAYFVALAAVFAFSVTKIDALPAEQAPDTAGANYLLVGTDNRENLTKKQRKALHTGYTEGQRTDTIMLLHVPLLGQPTLVSIPRDSWVPIEGYGSDKINAAYALGGPELLVNTVETVTGLRMDHYVEIGMDGVAEVVDSLGGVTLCPKDRYNDERSGLNVKAGCQEMDGKTALAYVRMRYSDPRGDIGRAERQREYIAAVAKKAISPLTWLNPFTTFSADQAAANSLTVDTSTGIVDDARMAVAMAMISMGWGESTAVPLENESYWVGGQQAVKWDTPKALKLFDSLA